MFVANRMASKCWFGDTESEEHWAGRHGCVLSSKSYLYEFMIYLETVPESSTAQLDIKFLRVDMHGVSECLLHVDFSSHNRHLEI